MLTLDVQAKARDFYERYFTSIIPGTNFEFLKHEVLIAICGNGIVDTFVSRLDEDEYNYLVSAVKENCYNAFNLDTLYNKLTLIKVAPSEIKNEKQHEHLWLENRGLVSGELLNDPSYVFYKVDLSGLSDIFKFGYDEVLLVVDMQLNRLAPISRALNFITLNFIQYHAKENTWARPITGATSIMINFTEEMVEDMGIGKQVNYHGIVSHEELNNNMHLSEYKDNVLLEMTSLVFAKAWLDAKETQDKEWVDKILTTFKEIRLINIHPEGSAVNAKYRGGFMEDEFEDLKKHFLDGDITADNHNLVRIFGQVAVCIMAALVTEARKRNLI